MSQSEHDAAVRMAALFTEAGLELPAVTIRRHADTTACDSHPGSHRTVAAGSQIDICTADTGAYEQRLMLHELAHAWAAHYLTPERKEAFRNLRHWQYWQDYERAEWRYNGTEQAAEIIVWALSDHPVQVAQLDHHSCPDLRAGYITLTGLAPLHGYTDRCDDFPPDRRS